jgi:hypothetical protein
MKKLFLYTFLFCSLAATAQPSGVKIQIGPYWFSNDAGISAGKYLYWGNTRGSSGYGFWDDGGTLKFKNSGGSWTAFGGGAWVTTGSDIYYSTGKVTIGSSTINRQLTIDKAFPSFGLSVSGTEKMLMAISTGADVGVTGTATGDYFLRTTGKQIFSADNGTTNHFQIGATGALKAGTYTAGTATFDGSGNITSSSDRRVKNSIKPFAYGLDAVKKLLPSTFIYNNDATKTVMSGFIAQDVQKVIPGAVHKGKDKQGTLSLETNAILAALVNAVKEQQVQIEALKKEIKALKAK